MIGFLFRLALITAAIAYVIPYIDGVHFHGHLLMAVGISLLFNLAFAAWEWLLAILVFGINIGTLGLGVLITKFLKFSATLMAPSAILYGIGQLMPKVLQISHFYPGALGAGLVVGSILWVSVPESKKR